MIIDMRKDAPDQSKTIDPEKLSTEVEKLQSIQSQIKNLEDQIKDLKEDEKYFSCVVIPKLMEDMNLSSLKLKDGSELSVKKIFSATLKADKKADIIYGDNEIRYLNKSKIIRGKKIGKIWRGMVFSHQSCFVKKEILVLQPFNIKNAIKQSIKT